MKFILNEKFILDEHFLLTEDTLPEYKKKEAELKKVIEDKKIEINEVLKNLTTVILGAAGSEEAKAAAQERLDKYEKPCNELVSKIDDFILTLNNKNLEIGSAEAAKKVDDFIEIAKNDIFPGGTAQAAADVPDLDTKIAKAAKNINNLIKALQELSTSMSNLESVADNKSTAMPTSLFSSDWTSFIKNAVDKKAAWEAYYRAWDREQDGSGSPDGVVYKRIAGLGTAFIQGLDKLGYTKANPFLVWLDRIIKTCPITWQAYAVVHNTFIEHKTTMKDWLEGKDDNNLPAAKNLLNNPQWHELNNSNLYHEYLLAQYNLWENNAQAAEKTVMIDGLTINEGDKLGTKLVDILYKDNKLRDIDFINQIASVFNANVKKSKEMSDADAESILSLYPGMAANDANAQDLAKMIIYTATPSANHKKIMAEHDLSGSILEFNNPNIVETNYNKLRNFANLGAQLSTILNALVPAKEKAK